jgi:hypothetical protein
VSSSGPTLIDEGLWQWSAPHPEWPGAQAQPDSPADWPQDVGCVLYEDDGGGVAIIDPQLPAGEQRGRLLAWLDETVAGRLVAVCRTIHWHERDCSLLRARYGGEYEPAASAGVQPWPLGELGETVYWLARVRALVPGDAILGAEGGGLRLSPEDWLSDTGIDRLRLAQLVAPLLELPIRRVLVSHGEPVLEDGHAQLSAALEQVRAGSA